jgi:hypothetical protein
MDAVDDPDLRRIVLARDDYVCAMCGTSSDLTLERVDAGAADHDDNLRTLCRRCAGPG